MQGSSREGITAFEALAIVVGLIIGSGIFLKPGVVLRDAGTPFWGLAAWIIGGTLSLTAALSIAEIAAAIPQPGGLYRYLEILYGEAAGFLFGWVQVVIASPAGAAAQAIAFAGYTRLFIPLDEGRQKQLALLVLGFLILMNVLSTKFGSRIQLLTTLGKLLPLAGMILIGILIWGNTGFLWAEPLVEQRTNLGGAVLGTLWAYEGWLSVTNLAGEVKNPAKLLPRVITLGVLLVMAVYVLFNLALFMVIPAQEMAGIKNVAAHGARIIFGSRGGIILAGGILISVFGSLNGMLLTGARVPQAMGANGRLPLSGFFARLHPRFQTPANAMIFQGGLSVIYILSGTFHALTDLLVFVMWIFFTMGVAGVFILRKRGLSHRDRYRVPLYPLTPILGVLGGSYIFMNTVLTRPLHSAVGIGITLAGLPAYYWLKRRK